jgi:hypothetical protein
MDRHVLPTFSGRILPIDTAVAQRCAMLHVPNPRSDRDALIAATALVHGLIVATRNVAGFERMGVEGLVCFRAEGREDRKKSSPLEEDVEESHRFRDISEG